MNHCSNCGEKIVGEQQFCRACGVELVSGGPQRRVDPRSVIFIGLLCTIASASLVLFGGYADSKTVSFIGTILALLSFGVMVTGAFLADAPRRQRRSKDLTVSNEQPMLEKADTTNQLPPIPANADFSTVTEHTTEKLFSKRN